MRALATALLAQLVAAVAAAQPAPGRPPAAPESHDVRLRAELQELVEKGHLRFTGAVDLQAGEVRIQSDTLDLYESERPDGTRGRRLVAVGNVVFVRESERIAGERLEMDLVSGQGTFSEAMGYVQPGVFIEARRIERLDATTYRVEGARFTSCAQPNPRWRFQASAARIHVDDKITASNVLFRVKSVPAFYLPWVMFPIREDQRSTGLLTPHFGYSSLRGVILGEGFFWAMGRSFDQTFYFDNYSKLGFGLGHEFRYTQDAPSRGSFRTYAIKPKSGAEWDWDLDYNAIQMLPGKFRAALQVRQFSSILSQQRIQDGLIQASVRSRRAAFNVQRNLGANTLQFLADSVETFFGEDLSRTNRHLPTLKLSRFPQKVGKSGLAFGYEAKAERLGLGVTVDDAKRVDYYTRFDVAPEISFSGGTQFLQLTPRAQVRYTHYGSSVAEGEGITGPALDRSYFEAGLDLRGPSFSRIFSNPGGFYSEKIKHVIGPEIIFQYRTPIEDFAEIPKFDYFDQALGTNQVQYGIVQRLYAKRAGPSGGKLIPYEFFTWRLVQTYYVQIGDKQNEFDPNYSSSAFGPGGVPDHNSPLQSRMRVRPTPQSSLNFDLEYDVNYEQLRTLSLAGVLNSRDLSLQAGWSRAVRLAVLPENRRVNRNTLNANARLKLPGGFQLQGATSYDFVNDTRLFGRAALRWDVQCCGFTVDFSQWRYNGRDENQWRFSIDLANVGAVGNFFADDMMGGATSGGYLGGVR